MVIATIQSKETGSNCHNITAVNGEILESNEAQPYVNKLYALIRDVPSHLDTEEILPLAGYMLCVQDHPERDEAGRIRPALVLWSDDESLESIKRTLQAMGLDEARFNELYGAYQAEQAAKARAQTKTRHNTGVLLAVGAAIAAIALIYLATHPSTQEPTQQTPTKGDQYEENNASR